MTSQELHDKMVAVNNCNSAIAARSTWLPRNSIPLFNISAAALAAAKTGAFSLTVLTSFSNRGMAFSKVCKSARQSSVLIVSISFLGSTFPSTWTTSPSLKTLITWQIASDSLIFAKNLFPSPAPSEAPLTIPAIFRHWTVILPSFRDHLQNCMWQSAST